MNTVKYLLLLPQIIVLAFFSISCESSTSGNDNDDDRQEGDIPLSATINGEDWSAPDATVTFSQGGPYLDIEGNTPDAQVDIWINIPEDIEQGTYDLKATGPGPYAVVVPEGASAGTHFPEEPGTLVIEQHDTDNYDIKGTFEFEAIRIGETNPQNFTVENGSFDFDGEFYSE